MTELLLVRHGQADSAGDNYDQLTATGHEQSRRVGEWLAQSGFTFTRLLHGGLNRQQQTLGEICGALAKVNPELPANECLPGLAEFDIEVWGKIAGTLRHGHPEFSELLKQWNKARHENAANKGDIFKRLTGMILAEWVKQGDNFTDAESFPAFRKRVLSVMDAGTNNENECFLAVTSGGPISLITGQVLGFELRQTLGLMRKIYNTSIHHFVLTDGKWELVSFNMVPHLKITERTLV